MRQRLRLNLIVFVALGFFTIVAQTLLFRKFFTVFEGSELGIGAFFGSWLVWIAAGALIGRFDNRLFQKALRIFEFLLLAFIPAFLLQHTLISQARELIGIASYELFPFGRMFVCAFLVNAPVSFLTGILFTLACNWAKHVKGFPVARVYIWEALGSFIGGVAITFVLSTECSTETAFLYAACALLVLTAAAKSETSAGRWTWILPAIFIVFFFIFPLQTWRQATNQQTWSRLLPEEGYEGSFYTSQGRYLYGTYQGQFNVLARQSITETLPNRTAAGKTAALNLAQNPDAENILVIAPGGFDLCTALQKVSSVNSITWLHPDPEYPKKIRKVLPEKMRKGIKNVRIPGKEPRSFLQHTNDSFDTVILQLPPAFTLVLNRYYTDDFFRLVKNRLSSGGILSTRLEGGENFLGAEQLNFGSSVFVTLQACFSSIAMKPGDTTWLFATDNGPVSDNPQELQHRFADITGASQIYPPKAIPSMYPGDRAQYQMRRYQELIARSGKDLLLNKRQHPKTLLYSLLLAAREAKPSVGWSSLWRNYSPLILPAILFGAFFFLCFRTLFNIHVARFLSTSETDSQEASEFYGTAFDSILLIFTVGIVNMACNIILMFLFQAQFGSVFLYVGLVSSLLMLGLFCGGSLVGKNLISKRRERRFLVPALLVIHLGILALIAFIALHEVSGIIYGALFFMTGVIGGTYVPIAAYRFRQLKISELKAGGTIELTDHAGGALGGVAAGILLVPALGLLRTVLISGGLIAMNMASNSSRVHPMPSNLTNSTGNNISPWQIRLLGFGYTILWLLCTCLACLAITSRSASPEGEKQSVFFKDLPPLQQMVEGRKIKWHKITTEDENTLRYGVLGDKDGGLEYLFSTRNLAPDVEGYSGLIILGVHVTADGNLLDTKVIESHETPGYMEEIKSWRHDLTGKNIFSKKPLQKVDAVTGATDTCRAVTKSLMQAGSRFAQLLSEATPQKIDTTGTHSQTTKESDTANTDEKGLTPPASEIQGEPRDVKTEKLKRRIENGDLSDHKAKYFRKLNGTPSKSSEK